MIMCLWILDMENKRKLILLTQVRGYQVIPLHCDGVIMGAMASQITSLTIIYSTVYSDADQIKHQSVASLAFVWGIHRGPVTSPHKWPVTRKMFPSDEPTNACITILMYRTWSTGSHTLALFRWHHADYHAANAELSVIWGWRNSLVILIYDTSMYKHLHAPIS